MPGAGHYFMLVDSVSKLTSATVDPVNGVERGTRERPSKSHPLACHRQSNASPSQRNPQSSIINRLQACIGNERNREGLVFCVMLLSARIRPIKEVINTCELLQIVTQSQEFGGLIIDRSGHKIM